MKKADLYKTPNDQERLVIGATASGDIAFATRGGNATYDYDRCQIQPQTTFSSEATFVRTVPIAEIIRVEEKFANYISENSIK